jgi:hypothetical protein
VSREERTGHGLRARGIMGGGEARASQAAFPAFGACSYATGDIMPARSAADAGCSPRSTQLRRLAGTVPLNRFLLMSGLRVPAG